MKPRPTTTTTPSPPCRPLLLMTVALFLACGDDALKACGDIPQQTLLVGRFAELRPCFEDPGGKTLTLSAVSSDVGIATVLASDSTITVRAVDAGAAMVTVTAENPEGQTASIDVDVRVMGPPRVHREDFDEGLGDWTPNFATSATQDDGMLRFHNTLASWFGIVRYSQVALVDWVLAAAVGNDTENTVIGLEAQPPEGESPAHYVISVGEGSTLDAIGDANYRFTICCPRETEESWWGRSDAIAGVGELTELGLAVEEGELVAWAGATELVRIDMATHGWSSALSQPGLLMWPERDLTGIGGFVDRVDLWGERGTANAAWHEGPADIPELWTTRPGVEITGVRIRER